MGPVDGESELSLVWGNFRLETFDRWCSFDSETCNWSQCESEKVDLVGSKMYAF